MSIAMRFTKLVVGDIALCEPFYLAMGLKLVSRNQGGELEVHQEQCWLSASGDMTSHVKRMAMGMGQAPLVVLVEPCPFSRIRQVGLAFPPNSANGPASLHHPLRIGPGKQKAGGAPQSCGSASDRFEDRKAMHAVVRACLPGTPGSEPGAS